MCEIKSQKIGTTSFLSTLSILYVLILTHKSQFCISRNNAGELRIKGLP
ncbi:hypothetical protein VAE130_571021 [Vibrio aestuarianus]|nr:hypothetical protein VAE308_1051022 [Vibrio aestuarianus]CAH8204087.1 hypothetical protein VIBAE_A31616 [Vibrio aestuarianus subsp. francensis]CAH8204816.1 hypothetical protein VAE032_271018 [Vibrio aestuarianus]CAH8204934.1 hypothetical protein VAE128_461024 [Vibrio aestuarianus]CAH8205114.1 hypothetical protein VAE130_571021 [Vibrio aestuarianus]